MDGNKIIIVLLAETLIGFKYGLLIIGDKLLKFAFLFSMFFEIIACLISKFIHSLDPQFFDDPVKIIIISRNILSQFLIHNHLIDFQSAIISLVSFISSYLLPCRPDIWYLTIIKCIHITLNHDCHARTSYLFTSIQLGTCTVNYSITQSVYTINEFSSNAMVLEIV